jgi:hypothetical protein
VATKHIYMKQLILFVALMLASVLAFAQTKRIAHRSHSGKDHTFRLLGGDNFGLPEKKPVKKVMSKKDSLKALPPAKADTIKTDTLKPLPPATRQPATKQEVYTVLLAAQKRYRSVGLL